MAAKSSGHRWTFPARFRRRGFGWRSQPAVQRVRQAADEMGPVRTILISGLGPEDDGERRKPNA